MKDSDHDIKATKAMIEKMNKATITASKAIDEVLLFVEQSNRRITKMEEKR